jgi:hypothetical protein
MTLARLQSCQHPAVQAWRQICSYGTEPITVEVLQEVAKGDAQSCIYRLDGVGHHGTAVIAKRCVVRCAQVEQTIYQDILPHLSNPRLTFYGRVDDAETDYSWLFLEEASGEEFTYFIESHRKLAAHWLGQMHVSAACIPAVSRLPDRGPQHYLGHLHRSRAIIQRSLDNSTLNDQALEVLESIISQGHFLESRWDRVEELCYIFPQTLVHCDFSKYNLRVRTSTTGMELLAFDWEMAGHGVPAPDLAELSGRGIPRQRINNDLLPVELIDYESVVRGSWPHLDLTAINLLAELGAVFRSLAAISWDSESIELGWWPIEDLHGYQVDLSVALDQLRLDR